MQVRLHHDSEQGLVHAAASFEQGGENEPAQLRDFNSRSPAVVAKVLGRVPLRCVRMLIGAFERAGAENAVASALHEPR